MNCVMKLVAPADKDPRRHVGMPRITLSRDGATRMQSLYKETLGRYHSRDLFGSLDRAVVTLRDDVYLLEYGELGLAYYPHRFASRVKLLLALAYLDHPIFQGSKLGGFWHQLMQGLVLHQVLSACGVEASPNQNVSADAPEHL